MSAIARKGERYTVLGKLGSGGMAEVLLAVLRGAQGFERLVVVKRMLRHLLDQPDHVRMFLDEARVLARIRHRNVVTVHDLVEHHDDYAIVMEYLEGENVATYLGSAAKAEQIDPWLAAYVISEAAAGLHAAHELTDDDGHPLNLVHRDVSPHNIFITYAGEVKILDFGVARSDGREHETATGVLKGKLSYMAPEQLGRVKLDRRADVFGLGIVLHEMCTGRRLFRRNNELATVDAVSRFEIPRPSGLNPEVPEALDDVVMKALERDRDRRYQTAELLRDALRSVLRAAPFTEAPPDRMAARMESFFAERMAEKRELIPSGKHLLLDEESHVSRVAAEPSLSRVTKSLPQSATSDAFGSISGSVSDVGANEFGAASHSASLPNQSVAPTRPSGPRRWVLVVMALVAIGLGAGFGFTSIEDDAPDSESDVGRGGVPLGASSVDSSVDSSGTAPQVAASATVRAAEDQDGEEGASSRSASPTDRVARSASSDLPTAQEPAEPQSPLSVAIEVITEPPSARVQVGDAAPCTAPCSVEVEASEGEMAVRGELDGYEVTTVSITPDRSHTVRMMLTPAPPRRAVRRRPRRRPSEAPAAAPRAFPVFD